MKEILTISITGTVEIITADYYQNPLQLLQNIWRVKVKHERTAAFIHIPVERSSAATNKWRKLLNPGSLLSFKGTVDNDMVIATEVQIKPKAKQLEMNLTETAQAIEQIKKISA